MTVDEIPIGRFSSITRLSVKALRYYDEKGLLVPEAKNAITGYRYYTGNQIQRGLLVKHLSSVGFSVEEIQGYLSAEERGDTEEMDRITEARLKETQSELMKLQRVAALLMKNKHRELIKQTMQEPTLKNESSVRIISTREKGITPETIGRLLGKLMAVVGAPENQANFVKIIGPPMTIYHDRAYTEDEGELEVLSQCPGR